MKSWHMVTLIGEDRPGIVAAVSKALYDGGCNLGEAEMARLGGNFTIMLMVQTKNGQAELESILQPIADRMNLKLHVDSIDGKLHQHRVPDVRVSVFCSDRTGIMAEATTALSDGGLDILDLESDVAGTTDKPIYIIHLEGIAEKGIAAVERAAEKIRQRGIEVSIAAIDTIIG